MMLDQSKIVIGLRVSHEKQSLHESLRAIFETAGCDFTPVILVDGDPKLIRHSQSLGDLQNMHIVEVSAPGGGGAASLNALIAFDADFYVMLEAGAVPAPGWLDHLLGALSAEPSVGAAGPSTNLCWNQQEIAHCNPVGQREIIECALSAQTTYQGRHVSMAPTHNLAEFCFAISREWVERVGEADMAYGSGPCWEMDYWARGAAAGLMAVWAQSAFVWRPDDAGAGKGDEDELLNTNKALYQSRFCGLQHGKDAPSHAQCDHCFGSACSEFSVSTTVPKSLGAKRKKNRIPIIQKDPANPPLISCVVPTRGRARFLEQSIHYFHKQDYPNRELIVVYESEDDLPPNCHSDNVRLVRTGERSIGGKREIGARAASGQIIAQWDDDDWYAGSRLSRQAAPIIADICDISALRGTVFMALNDQKFWEVTPALFDNLFVEGVLGGTLMFKRELWEGVGPYPAISLREDVALLERGIQMGARLCRIDGRELYAYVRHGKNSWRFAEGQYLDPEGWRLAKPPAKLESALASYQEIVGASRGKHSAATLNERSSVAGLKTSPVPAPSSPLVSCIMPTFNRHHFIPHAIEQFLAQDYVNRELIILDDSDTDPEHLVRDHPSIRFHRSDVRKTLGEKRNAACNLARGEFIAHWDDDDWMAPSWLSSQIALLTSENADISGIAQPLFYDPSSRSTWRYIYRGSQPWVAGGTLCYRRNFWARNRFASINVGEDNLFLWSPQEKRLVTNPQDHLYVARIHAGNTSPKNVAGSQWHRVVAHSIETLVGADFVPEAGAQAAA